MDGYELLLALVLLFCLGAWAHRREKAINKVRQLYGSDEVDFLNEYTPRRISKTLQAAQSIFTNK
jgi:hypothetical protein